MLYHFKVLLKGHCQVKNQIFLPLLTHKMTKLNRKDRAVSLSALSILTRIEQDLVWGSKKCLDAWRFSQQPRGCLALRCPQSGTLMLRYTACLFTSTINMISLAFSQQATAPAAGSQLLPRYTRGLMGASFGSVFREKEWEGENAL